MSQSEQSSPAGQTGPAGSDEAASGRCGHGVPVRFVCTACVEAGGARVASAVRDALTAPVPGRAYTGPYPNRAHRSVAELDARTAAADHDVLAYLARRRGNAERVARVTAETDELHALARDRARQLAVLIDEIRAGLHHGEAAAQAAHTGFAAESNTASWEA